MTADCSSQQAAAAWAWFEHGGGTCLTPSKAEGLMAAKSSAKCNFGGPSRFKKELLSSSCTAIPPEHSAGCSNDAIGNGHARRRHSFHDDDLAKRASYIWRFSSSCRSTPTSPRFNREEGPDQDDAEDEEGENTSCSQVDDHASSLLDKFEVDAVCRQLQDHISSSGSTSRSPSSTCSAELYEAHKAHLQPYTKPRRSSSSDTHKALTDKDEHQNINDVVHWLLRLRIKTWKSSFCNSIATADSIVHRQHPASPKKFRSAVPPAINRRQETLHDRSNSTAGDFNQLWVETTDEGSSGGQLHGRGEFASSHRKAPQQKMPAGRSHLELNGGALPTTLRHPDYSKALQPVLMSRLPHNMHGAPASTVDGVARTNRHRHFHKHHYIFHHHHHHHHYHQLQHIHQGASQDAAVLLDPLITKNDGVHVLHPPKLYRFHKEELMPIPPGGRPHHDQYIVEQNAPSLYQLAAQPRKSRYKSERYHYTSGKDDADLHYF